MAGLQDAFGDARCAAALSDAALIDAMLRFEGALARACARAGIAPRDEAEVVARICAGARFEPDALAQDARRAGTLAIPIVRELSARVAAQSPAASRWVHYGATSQDLLDSATVLCVQTAGARVLELLARLGDAAAALAERHARTPMLGRTLLQPAAPIPFGWKAAVWLSLLTRSRRSFAAALEAARQLQYGGASGTLSSLGEKASAVAAALAEELGLPAAPITWHSARDAYARLGAESAILSGNAGKIARDIALLMQPEVGELAEPEEAGRGGSSAMPHKRNPVGCTAALETAQRAPALAATLLAQLTPEHERGLGQWQSQWLTLRDLLTGCAGALEAMGGVLEGLAVDAAAMRANLERMRGLVYSEPLSLRLAESLGRERALSLVDRLVAEVSEGRETLAERLQKDSEAAALVDASAIAALFDPQSGFAAAQQMIARALADWRAGR
jgi:3-carboxy-cis,cis-muconate cycloisomerase